MAHTSPQNRVRFEEAIPETESIALISHEYTAIEKLHSLDFIDSHDDLDDLVFATLILPSGNRVALVSHEHSSEIGTEICVQYNQQSVVKIINETLAKINLTVEDLSWVHPDYEQELYNSMDLLLPPRLDEQVNYPQKLAGVDFSNCALKNIDLEKADLKRTIFQSADLSKANLQGADLREANLEQADLRGAKLQNANLQGANLKGVDFRGANLSRAQFQEANLEGVNFQRANLRGAILNESNLDNASFKDADLEDAHLYDIEWTTKTMWFHVIGLHKAIGIPENLEKQPNFKYSIALSKGVEELKNNNLEQFRSSYKSVIAQIDDVEIAASLWNKLAWLSLINGYPDEESYKAAIKAVQLKEDQGNYHDTLGIILALNNDLKSAIKQFEIALKSNDVQTWSSSFRERREKWIQALQTEENPFTSEELSGLRNCEY